METKHTPGPWHYQFNGFAITIGDESTRHNYLEHDYTVAKIGGNSMQDEANARLIAAAPDLLEACEEALGQLKDFFDATIPFDDDGSRPRNRIEVVLRAAIAKARGKQ
jgi:hypothetical protein